MLVGTPARYTAGGERTAAPCRIWKQPNSEKKPEEAHIKSLLPGAKYHVMIAKYFLSQQGGGDDYLVRCRWVIKPSMAKTNREERTSDKRRSQSAGPARRERWGRQTDRQTGRRRSDISRLTPRRASLPLMKSCRQQQPTCSTNHAPQSGLHLLYPSLGDREE